ncbi:hypothetical protein [Pseudaestuariivita rosea]|uniref:hypothetical protein n=1 Tax=Pseudaestuariivita rosea TaxID=2763263 RepID=UPI001ABB2517|nr:hypothetical protein [Pseudaestuariivita rosea]
MLDGTDDLVIKSALSKTSTMPDPAPQVASDDELYAIIARNPDDDPVILKDYDPVKDGRLSVITSIVGRLSLKISDTGDTLIYVGDVQIAAVQGVPNLSETDIHFELISPTADLGDEPGLYQQSLGSRAMVIDDFDPEVEKLELDHEQGFKTWTAVDRVDGKGANLIYAGRVVAVLKGVRAYQLNKKNILIC